MSPKAHSKDLDRINETILNSIAELFAEPDFDSDAGELRFLDRDDKCVWLGLFPTNEEGEAIDERPVVTWTIEATYESKGAAQ